MKIYRVSTKYGRSPYTETAYVDAENPREAIVIYCGNKDRLAEYHAEGFKFRATVSDLPAYYWEMADYCRPEYIQAY